jgi:hypothetical protein
MKNQSFQKYLFSSLLVWFSLIFLSACNSLPNISRESTNVPSGVLIYKDDFSNSQSGWQTWNNSAGSMVTYQADGLRIMVSEPYSDILARNGKRYTDTRLEVDGIKLAGENNNHFGLVCRLQDPKNYYAFLISSNGYYGIAKMKAGKFSILGKPSMEYNQSIHLGESLNHLHVECAGKKLSLAINGENVIQVNDPDFQTGEAGLIVGTYEARGAEIYFDNFFVYQP